ncbi:transglutaminase family protein [Hydrogenophaga sp.]|uniref:transglutaminase-like domain-containing protein n=1 Tax=Hydrogenophaga sp. TaxID=1904254 RepID=UPI00272FF38C|nr:transglutaminase family protein [Hydrogenophaga sp.]MDP2015410.1 transglutaminase family protein [Hydrogenophaga sp.]MDP3811493.1 transglutaminase family protein [Hydrogenophaga sp.]
MVRIHLAIDLQYEINPPSADFIFNVQAAHTPHQTVVWEELQVSQPVPLVMHTDAATRTRTLRLTASPGQLQLRYRATLDIVHHVAQPDSVFETPISQLPAEVLTYIYPSRYCQSDCVTAMANTLFGHLPQGYRRVQAIQHWVQSQVTFESNTSNSMTSALDTLNDHKGVCRDFAHLMITLCRALNIPARFTTAIDFGADPALGPTDFHAYVEAYIGHRWYIFDPSGTAIPMGFVRIGTGRDAADASFATIFGNVVTHAPRIDISAQTSARHGWLMPVRRPEALSTDSAFTWNAVDAA